MAGRVERPRRSRLPILGLLVVAALLAKRRYKNAALPWLVKRLAGWLLLRIVKIRVPEVVSGRGSTGRIGELVRSRGLRKPLVVTDEMLVKHGLVQQCLDSIKGSGLDSILFDKVVPNPPSDLVDEGYEIYKTQGCDCIVAFGGGSPMDTAKVIGAKVCNPAPVEAYEGFFRATWAGLRTMPLLVAVPTTAGTGSEATVAALINVTRLRRKIAIADFGLVPRVAVLDPQVLEKLPKAITAATGMDALTHAIESYMSGISNAFTRRNSLSAIRRIFKYMEASYSDGSDLEARGEMLQASYEAGLAITRANVGYVHGIAHQLGGMFGTPHGDANAMLLPHVMEFYLADEADGSETSCTDFFCDMAVAAGLSNRAAAGAPAASPRGAASENTRRRFAQQFLEEVRRLIRATNIPTDVPQMKASDVKEVATRALRESHGTQHNPLVKPLSWLLDIGYPNPKYMTQAQCEAIVEKILPASERTVGRA